MMKKISYILLLCFCVLMQIAPAFAQLPDKKFRIMDATEDQWSNKEFLDGSVEQGLEPFHGASAGGLKVYIMFTTGADSLIAYQRDNAKTAKLNAYIRYYEEHTYMINPDREGVFSLKDANWIAEELYRSFKPLIDYWISTADVELTPYSVALVVFHEEKGVYEKHEIDPIINNNSTDARAPIYYKGAQVLTEQTTSAKMKTGKIRKSTIVKGSFLPIAENINAQGPSNMRLVIDRVVRPCTFKEDLRRVQKDFAGNKEAQAIVMRLLGHQEDADSVFRQMPFVFAGTDFQKSLYRRTAGVLRRDTMEYYREQTNIMLAAQMGARDFKQVDPDTIGFELDQSLWFTACQYEDFKPLKTKLLDYAQKQKINLPADGGRALELGEVMTYNLEVDSATFNALERYVARGHKIAHDKPRLSSDQFIPGWISNFVDVVPNASDSVIYQVSNSSVLSLKRDLFKNMEKEGRAQIIARNDRDSIYRVRVNSQRWMEEFESVFDVDTTQLAKVNIYLTEEPRRTVYNWEFKMPNVQKYYKMEHVNYFHDFIHVDTTMTEECPCDRATPLMFLSIGAGAARYDCPPFIQGKSVEDDFRPISSSREQHTVDRSARLQFAKGSSTIERKLGDNDSLLEYMSMTIEDILFKDEEDGASRRRIDSLIVSGISSPEGAFQRNQELSHQRASSLGQWLQREVNKLGGQNPRIISKGAVASWSEVADYLWEKDSVANKDMVDKIREACANNNSYESIQAAIGFRSGDPVLEEALATLRKTEVRFFYQDIQDPTEKMVLAAYRQRNWEMMDAYYYWTILRSDEITKEEKIELSKYLLEFKANRVKNFTRTTRYRSYDDYFDLVLPMAATLLVTDSIDLKIYNTDILRPFIDVNERSQRGNAAYTTDFKGETKVWKYINVDFILYNQVLSLLGKGDQNSLREADVLIQFLNQSPTTTEKFDNKYHRKALSDYLKCYTSDFLTDDALAQSIAASSVVNFYIVNMSIAHQLHQQDGGTYSNERERKCFKDCFNRLNDLKAEGERVPSSLTASHYFTAVTEARYAEAFCDADGKREHFAKAIEALVNLFKSDENGTFISRCQGDSYVRGMYSSPAKISQGMDIYLEAVEAYINDSLTK